jgi:starvation-inducible DNA-binding protein
VTKANGNQGRYAVHVERTDAQLFREERNGEIQPYGVLANYPTGLSNEVRATSVEALNQLLADTMALRDMYKKHHWQTSGPTFYSLHLLFHKHYREQERLVDLIAERVHSLGGVALAVAHDVVEVTALERPARGREDVPTQLSRLLQAHEIVLTEARRFAMIAEEGGDVGTNDMIISAIIRCHEREVRFVAEHVVPVVEAEGTRGTTERPA